MKTKFLILSILFFVCSLAQNVEAIILNAESQSVYRYYIKASKYYYYSNFGTDFIGKSTDTPPRYYRSLYRFKLPKSLPAGAFDIKAELNVQVTGSGSNNAVIGYVGDQYNVSYYEEIWKAMGKTPTISRVKYGDFFHKIELKNLFTTAWGRTKEMFFSARSENPDAKLESVDIRLIISYKTPVKFTIKNNFGAGKLLVNNQEKPSGYQMSVPKNGTNVKLEAIENQAHNGYQYIWNDNEAPKFPSGWKENNREVTKNKVYQFSVKTSNHNKFYEAGLRKVCNVNVSSPTAITASYNGNNYSGTSVSFDAIEYNDVTLEAPRSYQVGDIDFLFEGWSDGNLNKTRTISVNSHQNLQAIYKGYARCDKLSMHCTSGLNEPVQLQWQPHSNSSVTSYQIYRKYGKTGTETLIATVNGTSYNDPDIIKSKQAMELVSYAIKGYYSPSQTWTKEPWWSTSFWGELMFKMNGNNDEKFDISKIESDLPTEFSTGNYPNPFNPTTQIKYEIPVECMVKIDVYNSIGKKVKTLVNENKAPGKYVVSFDASDLSSGMYIYTIKAGKFIKSEKMLLIK